MNLTGNELRHKRKMLHLTQNDLGNRLGVSKYTVMRLERLDDIGKLYTLAFSYLESNIEQFGQMN